MRENTIKECPKWLPSVPHWRFLRFVEVENYRGDSIRHYNASCSFLAKAGLIAQENGFWRITDAGKTALRLWAELEAVCALSTSDRVSEP